MTTHMSAKQSGPDSNGDGYVELIQLRNEVQALREAKERADAEIKYYHQLAELQPAAGELWR